MRVLISISFAFIAVMGIFNISYSQDLYVDIQCTNQYPGVGEKIKLSYVLKLKMKNGMASVSHNGIQIQKPDFKTLTVVDEGTEGNSFSFGGFGGGDMQVSKYSFILQPTKKGEVTIAPFTFIMNGEKHSSESYTVHVGEGKPNTPLVQQNEKLFIRIEVSKKEMYQGEHALVTYTLYSRFSNISIQDYEFPMTNGFWAEEISGGSQGFPQTKENIGGNMYLVVPLKKEVVYAQKTGEVTIPPFTLDMLVGGGFFSQGTSESLTSNSPTIKVKPLPSSAPNSFENQVGKNYKLEMTYSTTDLKAGEPIDVKIKISGQGNLKQLEAPSLNFPVDFETYDPETSDKIKLSTSGLSGYKEFSYLVIPRHHGEFNIPAFEYSYFDLDSKSYQTLTYPEQQISVAKGDGSTAAISTNSDISNKEDVEVLNNEIRHIVYQTNLKSDKTSFFNTVLFWTGISIPIAAVIAGFLFIGIKPKEKDQAQLAKKTASKKIHKTFSAAEAKLTEKNDVAFYGELYKGLMQYLSNKFSVPTSILTKEKIQSTLQEHHIDSTDISKLLEIVDECEMARFAPVTHTGAQDTMQRSKELIQNIERNAK